jgi:hypothetical protein
MKSFRFFLPALLLLFLLSCKKRKNSQPDNVTPASYMPLSAGSYWIYQMSEEDSSGNFTYLNMWDSIYVSKDTIMNNRTYYKMEHSNPNFYAWNNPVYISDSSGFLIDESGGPFLDALHLNDTIKTYYQPWSGTYYLIPRNFTAITTPLSTYDGVMMTWNYPNVTSIGPVFYPYRAFARGIGIVRMRTGFISWPWPASVAQLIRYHLN